MAQLKQIHLGVAAAYFLATWNKKPFESRTSICLKPRNNKPGSLTHSLSYGSKWRQVRWGTWPRDVPTCEEDIIVVDNRGLLLCPGGELVLALTSEGGEELGEVESCVGGLQNIFLEWCNLFSYYGGHRRLFPFIQVIIHRVQEMRWLLVQIECQGFCWFCLMLRAFITMCFLYLTSFEWRICWPGWSVHV